MLVVLKLRIGANNAQMGFNFVPILGQYGVHIKDFCTLFNQITKNYKQNVPMNVKVLLLANNKYKIDFYIPLSFFINFYKKTEKILLKEIYTIMYIYYFITKNPFFIQKGFARTIVAVLQTMKIKIY